MGSKIKETICIPSKLLHSHHSQPLFVVSRATVVAFVASDIIPACKLSISPVYYHTPFAPGFPFSKKKKGVVSFR